MVIELRFLAGEELAEILEFVVLRILGDGLRKEAEDLRKELKATLKSFPRAKTEKLAILFKTTTRTIARQIKALQDAGELKRVGSRKTGYWQVIEKGNEAWNG